MRGWRCFALGLVLAASTAWGQAGGNDTVTPGYNRICDGPLLSDCAPRRRTMEFSGATVSDDPASGRTIITITGGGGGGGTVQSASNLGTGEGVFESLVGVDLRFKSLTGNSGRVTLTSSGTEIDFDVDESVLDLANIGGSVTDAQVPNTITLDNLTQITTRSHSSLQNLSADDHLQYALADKSRPSPWVSAGDLSSRSLADLGTRAYADLTGTPTSLPPSGSAGGDLTGTYPNPTLVGVISAGGPTGSATVAPIITYDAKGRLTTVSSATITPAASSITGGAALTRTNDTNVTLTLGGTPASALLQATSITAGWTGTLGLARGGTNADLSATGGTSQVLKQSSTGAAVTVGTLAASEIASPAALTRVNDTNVTLTLGGTPSSSLLAATSLTLGWTGTLGLARGGTNADLSATGGTSQVLKQSSTGAAITVGTLAASDIASGAALTRTNDTNVTLTLGGSPTTSLLAATSLTLGWTGTLGLARGGTNADLSATGGTSQVLKQSSTGAAVTVGTLAASDIASGAALTRSNDTNVTLTLGGAPTTALLAATSLTLGWTGTLGLARGGTNADLSATGGTSRVLKQVSTGAAITVAQLAFTDLSGSLALTQLPAGTADQQVIMWDATGADWENYQLDPTGFTCDDGTNLCNLNANVTLLGMTIGDDADELQSGTSTPATCSVGEIYVETDNTIPSTAADTCFVHFCIATNTWACLGDVQAGGHTGGQTIRGGGAADEGLTLQATGNADMGTITFSGTPSDTNETLASYTLSYTAGAAHATTFMDYILSVTNNGGSFVGESPVGYQCSGTLTNSASIINTARCLNASWTMSASTGAVPAATVIRDGTTYLQSSATTSSGSTSIVLGPTYKTTGAVASTITTGLGVDFTPAVQTDNAGGTQTITNLIGFRVSDDTNSGAGTETVTNYIGFDVADLSPANSGTAIAFRNQGTDDQNRLAGSTIMGSGGTSTAPSARLEVWETTNKNEVARFRTTATNSDPNYKIIQTRASAAASTTTNIDLDLTAAAPTDAPCIANSTCLVEVRTICHCTSGSSCTTNQGGGNITSWALKNNGGTIAQIGAAASGNVLNNVDASLNSITVSVSSPNIRTAINVPANIGQICHITYVVQNVVD